MSNLTVNVLFLDPNQFVNHLRIYEYIEIIRAAVLNACWTQRI